jgi:hypothetical protein
LVTYIETGKYTLEFNGLKRFKRLSPKSFSTKSVFMIKGFEMLNDRESEIVFKAPLLVCILIAGADGKIDQKEIQEALSIAQEHYRIKSVLAPFFKLMAEDFEDKFKILIQSYPYDSKERNERITKELSQINDLWLKLPGEFSKAYYEMLKSLAQRIASSSGGLLGMNKIAAEEARYLNLPMIVSPE